MDVYEFDKCLLDRLEESMSVLSWKDEIIPSSQVRTEWAYIIELQIEPTGWQALWKIPRVICEELQLRFPTVVFGMVEQVLFKELKAVFMVQAVQDDDVHLPERHEVSLEDLWPTLAQENTELNVDRTADCIDRLRFFYSFVWMPWDSDNDDDLNWVEKHLESRIRFCYDLRKRSIKRALAAHIRTLLIEAKYIQQRREYLELGLSDDEELEETLDKSQITDLMRLHLRLAMIRSEMELLENPEMRRIYEEVHFDDEKHLKHVGSIVQTLKGEKVSSISDTVVYLVATPSTVQCQIDLLTLAKMWVPKDSLVHMCPSLQHVLNICKASDHIYLSPGRHTIKFLEYLNDNGSITGVVTDSIEQKDAVQQVVIRSTDDDSVLLIFDGDFLLENLTLDCANIRTGILLKQGKLKLKNCHLIGDGKSSTQQGVMCCGKAKVTLENCVVENFATGIVVEAGCCLSLPYTKVLNCAVGIDLSTKCTVTHFKGTNIYGSTKCGIYLDSIALESTTAKNLILQNLIELKNYMPEQADTLCAGDCDFKDCRTNVYIVNQTQSLMSRKTIKCIFAHDEINNEKEVSTICKT